MKTNANIPASLVADIAGQVSKHKSPKAIAKAVINLIIAIAAGLAIIFGNLESQSWGPMCLGCIVVICLIMSFVYMFGSTPELRYNGSKINGYQLYFNNPSIAAINVALRDKDRKVVLTYMNKAEIGLRLNVAISEDDSLKRMQFFKYVPFEYKPESEIIEIDAETAEFIEKL